MIVPVAAAIMAAQASPQVAVDALIAADRDFAAQAQARTPVATFEHMLDGEAAVAIGGRQYFGRDAVLAAMRAAPAWAGTGMIWAPVRGGISADGTHGFTFGYLEIDGGGDPARAERKYLAYWVKRAEGWRVLAYRAVVRGPGEVSTAMVAPSLPGFTAAVRPGDGVQHRAGLAAAEQAFSDLAQRVGLRAAFGEYVRADGMILGGSEPAIRIGHDAVIAGFEEGATSPVRWNTDRAFVASSGDLGVSIGTIYLNAPQDGQPASIPFFTVWRRDGVDQPWRYIAE